MPDEFEPAPHRKALSEAGIEATGSLVSPDWAHMPEEPEKAKEFLVSAMVKLEAVGGTTLVDASLMPWVSLLEIVRS